MKTEAITNLRFFGDLESSMKSYRQAIQKDLVKFGIDITFDQWQLVGIIKDNRELRQTEIAAKARKDTASVTRIIELLQKKGYLTREVDQTNRRRTVLNITEYGDKVYQKAGEVVTDSTTKALKGMKAKRMKKIRKMFKGISKNCR